MPVSHPPAVRVVVQLHDRPAVPLQGGVVIAVPVDVPQHYEKRERAQGVGTGCFLRPFPTQTIL